MPDAKIDEKIMNDLIIVHDKMNLCDSMLRPISDKINGDYPKIIIKYNSLLEVIGYLEACAPRMIELVEAAAQGLLSEPILMKCLEINDRLTKMLSDIDKITFTEPSAAASAASASTTNETDLFFEESNTGNQKEAPFDDFDAFLNERVNK